MPNIVAKNCGIDRNTNTGYHLSCLGCECENRKQKSISPCPNMGQTSL